MEELWIGLNDLKLQMNFEWSDGSLVSFTHWHPFEPNNFRDSLEDCVTIWGPVRLSLLPHHSTISACLRPCSRIDVLLAHAPPPSTPRPFLPQDWLAGLESHLHFYS